MGERERAVHPLPAPAHIECQRTGRPSHTVKYGAFTRSQLAYAIKFRALCGADLGTSPLKFRCPESFVVNRVETLALLALFLLASSFVSSLSRKVHVRLPGKGNPPMARGQSTITMIRWIWTRKLTKKKYLSTEQILGKFSILMPQFAWRLCRLMLEGRCTADCKREFKLPWREAGAPNHRYDKVDSDQ